MNDNIYVIVQTQPKLIYGDGNQSNATFDMGWPLQRGIK